MSLLHWRTGNSAAEHAGFVVHVLELIVDGICFAVAVEELFGCQLRPVCGFRSIAFFFHENNRADSALAERQGLNEGELSVFIDCSSQFNRLQY